MFTGPESASGAQNKVNRSPHQRAASAVFVLAFLRGSFTFDKALFSPFGANSSLTAFRNDVCIHQAGVSSVTFQETYDVNSLTA